MSKIEVDAIDKQSGSTLTLGGSGTAVTLASGATQTGFGRTGTVDWQTAIKTGDFTAANGEGYFVNTTSGAITVTLPASPTVGNIVAIKDYANTSDTNAITIARNGSNLDGGTNNGVVANEGGSVTLVYADATKGWLTVDAAQKSDLSFPEFITATGGTITTVCTNFKVHTFTGPGTFTVSSAGNASGSNTVDYLVIAGGGGGAHGQACFQAGGGGGAGGYRESGGTASGCYTVSPLGSSPSPVAALPVTATGFPIVVGGGGAGAAASQAPNPGGAQGANSSFSTITSTGGGDTVAFSPSCSFAGGNGGSGGGGSSRNNPSVGINPLGPGGNGNTPPVSPPQGQNGGAGTQAAFAANHSSGGGGGAGGAGTNGCATGAGGNGGAAATSSINGTPTARAGGGGGASDTNAAGSVTGGGGVGGNATPGNKSDPGTAGTANTGGGGGGGASGGPSSSAAGGGTGGSGVVIIRYRFQ